MHHPPVRPLSAAGRYVGTGAQADIEMVNNPEKRA
jgi:hypothetical protein